MDVGVSGALHLVVGHVLDFHSGHIDSFGENVETGKRNSLYVLGVLLMVSPYLWDDITVFTRFWTLLLALLGEERRGRIAVTTKDNALSTFAKALIYRQTAVAGIYSGDLDGLESSLCLFFQSLPILEDFAEQRHVLDALLLVANGGKGPLGGRKWSEKLLDAVMRFLVLTVGGQTEEYIDLGYREEFSQFASILGALRTKNRKKFEDAFRNAFPGQKSSEIEKYLRKVQRK